MANPKPQSTEDTHMHIQLLLKHPSFLNFLCGWVHTIESLQTTGAVLRAVAKVKKLKYWRKLTPLNLILSSSGSAMPVKVKVKTFPYSIPSVGPRADPAVHAVSPQVSHPPGGRLPLLSTRPAVTSPAAKHHRPLAGTKIYCLVTETRRREQLAWRRWMTSPKWSDNNRAKGNALTCINVQQLKCLEPNGELGVSFLSQLFNGKHLQTRLHTLLKHIEWL